MVLALEFWTPPFHFLTNALANLLVFVAKCLGVSWEPFGACLGPLGTPLGPLGNPSELPWTPSDAGGRVVGSH